MSNQVLELSADNFAAETKEGVVLVDFWAPWCAPCRAQLPIIEKVADSVAGKAKVAKVNVDEAGAVAQQFGVNSIPTLILLKDGQLVQQFVGVQPEAKLTAAIEAV